jgi:hypothetical protein
VTKPFDERSKIKMFFVSGSRLSFFHFDISKIGQKLAVFEEQEKLLSNRL